MTEATWSASALGSGSKPANGRPLAEGDALPSGPSTGEKVDRAPANLDGLSANWRAAFDLAHTALLAAADILPSTETHDRTMRLADERKEVAHLLEALARDRRSMAHFWVVAPWDARRLLGLTPAITACVFSLDGVLIGSAAVHAAAWAETFDEFISRRIERTRGLFAPFNPRVDYYKHMHARPRLEGVRAFLASRGIGLPEGDPEDAPGTETVHGLANRKGEALMRRLDREGPRAFAGSQRYLELARDAGVRRAITSASANARANLEQSGLDVLIDECVDGNTMAAEHLRAKPEPDTLLAACRQLGVEASHAAAFETTVAGVASARAAGFGLIVGVNSNGQATVLREAGAHVVIAGLAELLDRNLAA